MPPDPLWEGHAPSPQSSPSRRYGASRLPLLAQGFWTLDSPTASFEFEPQYFSPVYTYAQYSRCRRMVTMVSRLVAW